MYGYRAKPISALRLPPVIGMPWQVFQRWQILGRLGIVKFIAAQPASLKPVPKQDGVHLPGKLRRQRARRGEGADRGE